jgi:hypothetical protein
MTIASKSVQGVIADIPSLPLAFNRQDGQQSTLSILHHALPGWMLSPDKVIVEQMQGGVMNTASLRNMASSTATNLKHSCSKSQTRRKKRWEARRTTQQS